MSEAPKPITPLALRAMRLRKLSAIARKSAAARRRFSAVRLQIAELILGEIVNGGDLLAEVTLEGDYYDERAVCVLVTMSEGRFRQLIEYGGDLEDDEDTNDAEPTDADEGEPPLGWGIRAAGTLTGTDELEPSLGSTGMANQERWAEGGSDGDRELDRCDHEDTHDREPSDADVGELDYSDEEISECGVTVSAEHACAEPTTRAWSVMAEDREEDRQ